MQTSRDALSGTAKTWHTFSITDQKWAVQVASSTTCLVHFPRNHLVSSDEMALDQIHQIERGLLRKPKSGHNLDLQH